MTPSARELSSPLWIGRGLVALATVLLVSFPLISDDGYYQNMIILSLVFAIGASGLNIITGFAGYVSLGQGAFIGLGGYTVGVLATKFPGISPWVWVPVAGVVAAAVALILGLVSLRSRGPSFVIITVAFLFLVQVIAVNWVSLTGGTAGLTLPLPSWDRDYLNLPFYYALVLILALQALMTGWIRRTKLGMGLIAIREDETKAASIGINLPVQKIIGFMASTVFVGMGGAVYGYYLTFIDPRGMFSILISVQIILSLLIGGRGTLWGPILGAFLIEPLNEIANNDLGGGNTRLFLFGGLLIAVVIFLPKGILPAIESFLFRRRTEGKAALVGARIGTGGSLQSLTERAAPSTGERTGRPRPRGPRLGANTRGGGAAAWAARRRRLLLRGAGGLDHRAHRPERLGQDHRLQRDRQHDPGRLGGDHLRRGAHRRARRLGPRPPRHRADLSDPPPVQRDDGARERRRPAAVVLGSPARPDRGQRPRGEGGGGAPGVRRNAGVQGPEGARALLRPAEAGGARPGTHARPKADHARRAGRRHQPGPHRADGRDDPGAQLLREDVPHRRAQHALRPGPVRSDPRPRPGRHDGLRHAGADPDRSRRHRG